jgi:hypothetical protein
MIRFIAVCWLLASSLPAWAADQCRLCHAPAVVVKGAHRSLACRDCHQNGSTILSDPADRGHGSAGCIRCHQGYQQMYQHAMGSRAKEKAFIARSYALKDRGFEQKNCASCHLQGCRDCHGSGHTISRPKADTCSRCHKGYYVGWDYFGRAPREEHERYQRGERLQGETFLKMLPDVHQQRGLTCSACHTMQSLIKGQVSAKSCTDCHKPSSKPVEHRIKAHLEKLECVACHAAWAPQEYGTFYLRFASGSVEDPFQALTYTRNGYAKSIYLKRQDLPPLGLNSRGMVAPIRPQFIAYYSQLAKGKAVGQENQLLAAEWRAFTPHTIQRGTVMCDGCHDNPRRFLLEPTRDRIYDLQQDGMVLSSFWNQAGQRVVNGSFMDQNRYLRMATKTDRYKRAYVEKWKRFLTPAAASSQR